MSQSSDDRGSKERDEKLEQYGLHMGDDDRVEWNEDNPDHPRNWSVFWKIYNNALIYWLEFFMTFISTAGTSAATSSMTEYGVSRTLSLFAFVSIYLIGQTVGGIFCSPLSETFGRRTLYLVCACVYCGANIITGVIHSIIPVFIGRFIAGFVAAVPATLAFGNFSDTHDDHVRIWIVYFYNLSGNLGLVTGPIYAAYIVETIGWRWIFYIAAIASAVSAVLVLMLKESHSDLLLEKKAAAIRKETDADIKTEFSEREITFKSYAQQSLVRPLQFLVTEPIVTFCAILCSIAYGLIYGSTESLTIVYESFGWSEANTSLAFLAVALGLILDIIPRFYDDYIFNKYKRENRQITAETKITSFAFAAPSLAVGLWIFGWTIPPDVHTSWVPSMIGLVLIGFSTNDFSHVLFGYVTDSYGSTAASAVASLSLSRTLVAAAFPLFINQMYDGLGSNVATSILAAVATLFAFTPFLFLGYAGKLKSMSHYAVKDDDGDGQGGEDEEEKKQETNQAEGGGV